MVDLLGEATIEYVTGGTTWQVQRVVISPDEIIDLFNTKEIDKEWSFEEYKPSDTGKWTHDYHRYPAKFIPQLVEKLIEA